MVSIKVETETTRDFYNDDVWLSISYLKSTWANMDDLQIIKDQRGEFFDDEQEHDAVSVPYAYEANSTNNPQKTSDEV